MPIYEFYCVRCNTVFSFFSRTVNTRKQPVCPGCGKQKLERMLSSFALTGKAVESGAGKDMPIDEAKMERAMTALAGEVEGIKEDDPRHAAKLMRKFTDMTGLELGSNMKEAMNRLEAGEDPEKIESEMGALMNGDEDPFILPDKKNKKGRKGVGKPPLRRDNTLYEL
ncbi:MAG: zinc ribbon domain-containing protein [Kiritimatiellae bacterium]|nr:zinc ribbon domain-containing protein [Kiritimatiellia bacterium]MDD5521029.1 zinc ribbon domain-containing protein [Kiritimatiellia bacterium]